MVQLQSPAVATFECVWVCCALLCDVLQSCCPHFIVCRNVYRGSAESFSLDGKALEWSHTMRVSE